MKKIMTLICIAALAFVLCSCYTVESIPTDIEKTSMFIKIEGTIDWQIVYHKETKVMYAVSGNDNRGMFTMLVNADGTPQIYKGNE